MRIKRDSVNPKNKKLWFASFLLTVISFVPARFFAEEILFEQILHFSDVFYIFGLGIIIYPLFSLALITLNFFIIRSFIRVWKNERRFTNLLFLIGICLVFYFLYFQGAGMAYSESQCNISLSENSLFSFERKCSRRYNPYFSLQPTLYGPGEYYHEDIIDRMIISEEEFNKILENEGNILYFCEDSCEVRFNHCSVVVNQECMACAETCYNNWKEKNTRTYISDPITSQEYSDCLYACKINSTAKFK